MKKLSILVLALSLFFYGCSLEDAEILNVKNQELTIFIQGDPGTPFSGSIMVTSDDGTSFSESHDGVVPDCFSFNGIVISGVFQKKEDDDAMLIILVTDKDNYPNPVKKATTTASYGLASVTLSAIKL